MKPSSNIVERFLELTKDQDPPYADLPKRFRHTESSGLVISSITRRGKFKATLRADFSSLSASGALALFVEVCQDLEETAAKVLRATK